MTESTLFERLGGEAALRGIVEEIVDAHAKNPIIAPRFSKLSEDEMRLSKQHAFEFLAAGTGGAFEYTGRDMRTVHGGMNISEQEFLAVVDDIVMVLRAHGTGDREQQEVLYALYGLKGDIIRI
jgi:hemoglobin